MAGEHNTEKYAYLDQLSTEALEELLRADIESPENDNDEAVFHILEVIEQRIGDTFDVEKAWTEFKQYYNIPEGEGLSLYPIGDDDEEFSAPRRQQKAKVGYMSHALKMSGIAAAIVIGIFGLMIGAQAAGIDVFGAIGRWTDETFHFVIASGNAQNSRGGDIPIASNENGYYLSLQSALDECGITEKLAPTWYPGEFEMSVPEVSSSDVGDKIFCVFNGPDDKTFYFQVRRYNSVDDLNSHIFEKDDTSVEGYTRGTRTFYIISNMDTYTATWSDGNSLMLNITGNILEDDIKNMIDSIGE